MEDDSLSEAILGETDPSEGLVLVKQLCKFDEWYEPFKIDKLDLFKRFFSLNPTEELCKLLVKHTHVRIGVNANDRSPQTRVFASFFLGLKTSRAARLNGLVVAQERLGYNEEACSKCHKHHDEGQKEAKKSSSKTRATSRKRNHVVLEDDEYITDDDDELSVDEPAPKRAKMTSGPVPIVSPQTCVACPFRDGTLFDLFHSKCQQYSRHFDPKRLALKWEEAVAQVESLMAVWCLYCVEIGLHTKENEGKVNLASKDMLPPQTNSIPQPTFARPTFVAIAGGSTFINCAFTIHAPQ